MRSEDAQVGKRVRIIMDHWRSPYRGLVGTIAYQYGAPEYLALDVQFGDGRRQLFWHHELEDAESIPRAADPARQVEEAS